MSNIDLEKLTDEQIAQIKAILTADNTNTASVKANNKNADDNNNDKSLEELFERDAKGNIRQSNYNCQLVLKHDPLFAGAIRYNEFSDKIDICRPLGWKRYGTAYCDNDLNHIITYIESIYGLKVDKHISRAVSVVASDNSYHPIREKLSSLSWDGQSRLPDALHHFLGVEN